jgi:hypothetical protein
MSGVGGGTAFLDGIADEDAEGGRYVAREGGREGGEHGRDKGAVTCDYKAFMTYSTVYAAEG